MTQYANHNCLCMKYKIVINVIYHIVDYEVTTTPGMLE